MSDYRINYIENNKAKFAYYIADTFAELLDNKHMQWELFGKFSDKIKNSNVFIIKKLNYKTEYQKDIDNIFKELNKHFSYGIESYTYSLFTAFADAFRYYKRENYREISDDELERLHNLYLKHYDYYKNVGIWYDRFLDFMLKSDEKQYEDMLSLVIDLNKKIANYNQNKVAEYNKEMFLSQFIFSKYSRFFKKYNLQSNDDLFNLLTEINSFTIDTSLLNDEELKQVEINKGKYRIRMNLKDDFNLSVRKANNVKRKIEKIYNDNVFNELFVKSNLGEFFKYFNIENNRKNIIDMVDVYLAFDDTEAANFYNDFGSGNKNFTLYKEDVFDNDSVFMNNVIAHEFVHCVERIYDMEKKENIFNNNYRIMNEVLTEFVARESVKKFLNIDHYYDSKSSEKYNNEMLLVEGIKDSEVFKYLILAKLYNDDSLLVRKIGRKNLNKVSNYFEEVWNSSDMSEKEVCFIKDGLSLFVKGIDAKYFNNNVRNSKR